MIEIAADLLIVGAGGAGMYAAIAAAREGASVLLIDKSIVGRGGATIMAQMTVAAAIGHQEPDDWTKHLADTVEAGRGLCNEELTSILCREGPARIMELDSWKIGWARKEDHLKQVTAPGHSRRRCVYVDFLNTGPALARTLRKQVRKEQNIKPISNLAIADILVDDGRVVGALGLNVVTGEFVSLRGKAVILASGGLSKLYARNSGSTNMGGDGYGLALRVGVELVDMEFVQFFPIAHLAPRLVGMDSIMWDPFRYKLGGRLLNGQFQEFIESYGSEDRGKYRAPRDVASYAILKEVEAGRGSAHGGAYLDFRHVPENRLRESFGPVIDRLLKNGIDLTQMPVEVAPMAHYQMGGVRVSGSLETRISGLFAAGEIVGGASGANRLSGNAITEALVFGERAGKMAAQAVLEEEKKASRRIKNWQNLVLDTSRRLEGITQTNGPTGAPTPVALQRELQQLMSEKVGPFRTEEKLCSALEQIREWRREILPSMHISPDQLFNMDLQDWLELRNMLDAAEMVALASLSRRESRGAHQREDFPDQDPNWEKNQVLALEGDVLTIRTEPIVRHVEGKAV
jgi:succinate dehydrogenase/fumarate reductase flavoprotein subunit